MARFTKDGVTKSLEALRTEALSKLKRLSPDWGPLSLPNKLGREAMYQFGFVCGIDSALCDVEYSESTVTIASLAEACKAAHVKAYKRYEKATGRVKIYTVGMGLRQVPMDNTNAARWVGQAEGLERVIHLLNNDKTFGRVQDGAEG